MSGSSDKRNTSQPPCGVTPQRYSRQLSDEEIARGAHRSMVGGAWEEIGRLQFDFLVQQGLSSSHRLLDVGCGALRGGIHFIRYLDPGHYHGVDMNASLIKAAREVELPAAGLEVRHPHLLVDPSFDFARFGTTFHMALAQSVFTHLPVNSIERCLVNMAAVLSAGGRFYATFFEAPTPHHLAPLRHQGYAELTYSDRDPYHYHPCLFSFLVSDLPLEVRNLGDWGHPRGQHMLEFVRR
jgi:SAM-dependent methyltransferase